MDLDSMQTSIREMSDDQLEELVSKIREQRGAKPIETVKKASALEKAIEGMTAEELQAFIAAKEKQKKAG